MRYNKTVQLISRVSRRFGINDYIITVLEEHPKDKNICDKNILLVGNSKFFKWAYLNCPCGCNRPILLSLHQNINQNWNINFDFLGRPSIFPSINLTNGCKSHFWLKKGKVFWVINL